MARGTAAAIFLLVLIAYWPALHAGYIWDDDEYVTGNLSLRSTEGLRKIWFEPGATPQYYPLVFTSFWVEYHLWELEPMGYHVVNILLHLLAGFLLWRCLDKLAVPYAWLASLVFVLHPVHVESVAWITERKNVLSLVFYLGSASLLIRFFQMESAPRARQGSGAVYMSAFALFVAALLSKTVTFSLPAAMLLIIWWKTGRIRVAHIAALTPYFILGAAGGLTTAYLEQHHVGARGVEWDYGSIDRILIAGRVIWFYAVKILLPVRLIFNYPRWSIDAAVWWQYLYPAAFAAVIAALWQCRRRIGRGPLVGTLFYCGTLFPALGFIDVYPFRYSFVADHFQYHASIGLIALYVVIMVKMFKNTPAAFFHSAVVLLLVLLTARTHFQVHDYRDQETLWTRTVEKNPESWIAHNNLGVMQRHRGKDEAALNHFKAALRSAPNNTEALNNLGSYFSTKGDHAQAMMYFQRAIAADPENAFAHTNLGVAYGTIGSPEESLQHYRQAVSIAPGYALAHNKLGLALLRRGERTSALYHLRRAGDLSPDNVQFKVHVGIALAEGGQFEAAVQVYTRCAELSPQQAEIYYNLGSVYSAMQHYDDAIQQFETALRLKPGYVEARINLGITLAQRGDVMGAKGEFEKVVRDSPENAPALKNLTQALWLLGEYDKARSSFQRLEAISGEQAALVQQLIPEIAAMR